MQSVVCKFGGSSVANAQQIQKIEQIILADENRKQIIVSAPGRSEGNPYKVTDLLYNLYFKTNTSEFDESFNYEQIDLTKDEISFRIRNTFFDIAKDLDVLSDDIIGMVNDLSNQVAEGANLDYVISRGEYFNAKIIADYLGGDFVDAKELITISSDGFVDLKTTSDRIESVICLNKLTVIPGFYGQSSTNSSEIRTFSRGGSDLTGSLVAYGLNATVYENWTDRDGISVCDPRLLPDEKIPVIELMSYRETRELTYMGFEIFNDESIGPLRQKNIPLHIKNTNNPSATGTIISANYNESRVVRGIAGRNGFTSINMEKYLMNKTIGFGAKALEILSRNGIGYEHFPSGIDNVSLVVGTEQLNTSQSKVLSELQKELQPDYLEVNNHIGLVAVVGEGMKQNPLVSAQIMIALAGANINIELISQGASESSIIFGVKTDDYKTAIKALYRELF